MLPPPSFLTAPWQLLPAPSDCQATSPEGHINHKYTLQNVAFTVLDVLQ